MKNKLTKIIYGILIFTFVFTFTVCSTTRKKTDVIEQTTGKTVFSFSTNSPEASMLNIPKYIDNVRFNKQDEFIYLLAIYIKKGTTDDFKIVKRAHDWVALKIKYDDNAYNSGIIPDQSHYTVLTTGLAVCAGYAKLFKRICDELKIECKIINGNARGVSYSLFNNENIDSNHSWNMVKIYGNWYLVDCTWDSGYLYGKQQKNEYSTDYLFIKPEKMIYSHFPDWEQDQLLNPPVTKDEFINMPGFSPRFFKYITDVQPKLNKMTKVDGRLKVDFYVNDDTYLMVNILDKYENETADSKNICRMGKRGNRYEAYFTFTKPGDYIVRLFSSNKQYGSYEWVADYGMTVTSDYKPTVQEKKLQELGDNLKKEIFSY